MSNNTPDSVKVPYRPNPSGICMCGCGQTTPLAVSSNRRMHRTKGEHTRYCVGHHNWKRNTPERFWEGVNRLGPDDCWEWMRGKNHAGYGSVHRNPNGEGRAHRVAYMLTYGPIPKGTIVCHRCDNRSCCNPAHLFLGTPRDNNYDMWSKGRGVIFNPKLKTTKLSDDKVREIRQLAKQGVTYTEIGRQFDISRVHAHRIATGKSWSHVE